ncbi:hypothetical protein H9P43_004403 [Blastocladiella emersonii ATCC 22665]|nr:hypothetical protein H9P43_004403 [Blastocladiella emersonii ATCC 22665]
MKNYASTDTSRNAGDRDEEGRAVQALQETVALLLNSVSTLHSTVVAQNKRIEHLEGLVRAGSFTPSKVGPVPPPAVPAPVPPQPSPKSTRSSPARPSSGEHLAPPQPPRFPLLAQPPVHQYPVPAAAKVPQFPPPIPSQVPGGPPFTARAFAAGGTPWPGSPTHPNHVLPQPHALPPGPAPPLASGVHAGNGASYHLEDDATPYSSYGDLSVASTSSAASYGFAAAPPRVITFFVRIRCTCDRYQPFAAFATSFAATLGVPHDWLVFVFGPRSIGAATLAGSPMTFADLGITDQSQIEALLKPAHRS